MPVKLHPELTALLTARGWTVESVATEGRRLVATCKDGEDDDLIFWLMPRVDGESCFRLAGHYLVGYRSKSLSKNGLALLEELAALLCTLPEGMLGQPDSGGRASDDQDPTFIYGGDQFEIRVTSACNEQCVFCNSWGAVENLAETREAAFALTKKAREQGANKLVVTGGEPLLVPWVAALMEQARNLGFTYLVVQTNGTPLADEGILAELVAAHPDEVLISVHGRTPETVGSITGRESLFHAKMTGLANALLAGLRVAVNFVVCRQNLEEIGQFVEYLAGLSPRPYLVSFSFVAPSGLAWENRGTTIPPAKEAAPRLLAALTRACELGLNVVHSEYCGIPTCVAPGLREFAEPHTDDRPMHVPQDKAKLSRCNKCEWDSRCSGIFKRYLELYGDKEFGPGP